MLYFDVNGVNVMEMNSIGETYAPELNYKVLILTVALYKQIILTVILYCSEGGTGRTQIEAIQFLDRTIYTTGTNIGTLFYTDDGYIKFNSRQCFGVYHRHKC